MRLHDRQLEVAVQPQVDGADSIRWTRRVPVLPRSSRISSGSGSNDASIPMARKIVRGGLPALMGSTV